MKKFPTLIYFVFASLLFSKAELIFYLPFDEISDQVIKDSVHGIEGKIRGKVEQVEGIIGKGIYFGGKEKESDCIVFPQTAKDDFFQKFSDGPFTISVWIKPDSKKDFRKFAEILNTSGDIGPGWRLTYFWNMLIFRSGLGPAYRGKVEKYFWEIKTNPAIDRVLLDQWNHVCVKRDRNKKIFMYLNGKKVSESDGEFEITTRNLPLTVGAYVGGSGYGFMGAIDEVKIYKGELTEEEIFNEYKKKNWKEKKITLDGKLDEEIWEQGRLFTNFFMTGTTILAPVQTKVIFNYDDDNLYFGFICDEPEMKNLKDSVKENTLKVYYDDSVEIMIDLDNDRFDYYHFVINSSGYYGVELRTEGGTVSRPIEEFRLYTGSSKEKERWILEVVIPYSSLIHERIKKDVSLNFARNRRVLADRKEESSIAEKGQFHIPDLFKPCKLENVDLSLYQIEFAGLTVKEVEKRNDGWFNVSLKGNIKNLTDSEREITLEIYNRKLGVLEKVNLHLLPKKEKAIELTVTIPEAKEYKLSAEINEKSRNIYTGSFHIKVDYAEISLELLKPLYRNSIYSTQKIKTIVLDIKSGLKEADIKTLKQEVLITDGTGNVIKKISIDAKKEQKVMMEIPELKDGEYKIIGRITEKGKTLYETSIPLYKMPPAKGSEVYIDENLNLVLNGKPILPIIWWGGSPFEEIAKTGADGIALVVGNKAREFLDELYKINQYGVVAFFSGKEREKYLTGKDVLSDEAIEVITSRINSIKNHPALLYYYLADEPEDRNISPRILKETYQLLKKLDPYHPVQLTNNSVNGISTYIECAEMFIPDPYVNPLTTGKLSRPMSYISNFMKEIKEKGRGKKFIGVTPQVFDYGKIYATQPPYSTRDCRGPSFIEERCMNYLAIVNGAKGFHYYVFGKKDPGHWGAVNIPDLRVGMPYLIKEKKSLSEVILHGKDVTKTVVINDERIDFSGKDLNGKFYLIAVNTSGETVTPEIFVSSQIKKLKVISEARNIEVSNGKFVDRFYPYDVHIYTDNLTHRDVINLNEVEQEIKKAGGWYRYSPE